MSVRAPSGGADAFFDGAPCGYIAASHDGVIRRVNRTLETMTGFAAEELVDRRTFASLLSVGGRIYVETHLSPLLLHDRAVRAVALELVHADGHRVPVLVSATLAADDDDPTALRIAVFEASERRAYEQELLAARQRAEESDARSRLLVQTLQHTLMPPAPPTVDGLDVVAAYRPAGAGDEVGGDFYDIFQLGTNDWIVAVGDVTGKGIAAATVTALARHAIRAAAVATPDPADVLTTLNDVLRREPPPTPWCTVAAARLTRDSDGWTVTTCHGGHPPVLHVDAHGRVTETGGPGPLLGAFDRIDLHQTSRRLAADDGLVLHTDGVTEARAPHGFFGEARLRDAVARHRGSAHGLVYRLLDDVMTHQAGTAADDIVIVAVHVPS
jgi:sigma-B regulation protein RsbU (phosphoserine phosphatase)